MVNSEILEFIFQNFWVKIDKLTLNYHTTHVLLCEFDNAQAGLHPIQ